MPTENTNSAQPLSPSATIKHLIKTRVLRFTDTHVHLDFPELNEDPDTLLNSCISQGIKRLIVPSVSPKNWQQVIDLQAKPASNRCEIISALGIHPWYLSGLTHQDLTLLEQTIVSNIENLQALGEMGLDGVIANEKNNLDQQIEFFEFQLSLAQKYALPAIVHHRRTHEQTIVLLKQNLPTKGGIIHAFSGSYQQAIRYIDLGFKLGIGGTITYPRAKKTINAIKRLPIESLVLETDAPSMPLNGFQGEANTPLRLINVFEHLVEIKQLTSEQQITQLATQLENNVKAVFDLAI